MLIEVEVGLDYRLKSRSRSSLLESNESNFQGIKIEDYVFRLLVPMNESNLMDFLDSINNSMEEWSQKTFIKAF
jgi:hypothetical protein